MPQTFSLTFAVWYAQAEKLSGGNSSSLETLIKPK